MTDHYEMTYPHKKWVNLAIQNGWADSNDRAIEGIVLSFTSSLSTNQLINATKVKEKNHLCHKNTSDTTLAILNKLVLYFDKRKDKYNKISTINVSFLSIESHRPIKFKGMMFVKDIWVALDGPVKQNHPLRVALWVSSKSD